MVLLGLAACQATSPKPLVVVASPVPFDADYQTYTHPSGVLSLRLPPTWIVDVLPDPNGLRLQFTTVEGAKRVTRLSIFLVNQGLPLTDENFLAAIRAYQPPPDLSQIPWQPVGDLAAMRDGSVRLTGVRTYPNLGARDLNLFFQANGTYFSVLEVDVTQADAQVLQTLNTVINTYRVDSTVPLNIGIVAQSGVITSGGVVAFDSTLHWVDSGGGFNITGRLTNTANAPLEAIRLRAYLFDAEGNQLAERSDILAYEVVGAGESAAFRLRFPTGRPTTAVRYELHAAARYLMAEAQAVLTSAQFLFGEDSAFFNSEGFLTIRGLVQNNAGLIAQRVKVIVTVYNEAAQVVGTEASFIGAESLLPAEAAPFEITLYELGGSPFRYTLAAQALSAP
jgi:hypothetical protein